MSLRGLNAPETPWALGLRLDAHGRRGAMIEAVSGKLRTTGRRSDIDRGEVKEWLTRSRDSVSHGLILTRPPNALEQAPTGTGDLLVDFLLSGTFEGRVEAAGRGLELKDGKRLYHYGELSALDADGRELPMRLELLDDGSERLLRLRIDDTAADYPITLLASLDEIKKLIQPTADADELAGLTVDLDGDTAVVGAPFANVGVHANAGKAYIFDRNEGGTDNWGLVKEITASDPQFSGNFGNDVSIDGDRIAVGSNGYDAIPALDRGRAYLFSRNEGGLDNWGEIKAFDNPEPNLLARDNFGWSLDLDGDTLAISAFASDVDIFSLRVGKAYVFQENQGGFGNWGLVQDLASPTPLNEGQFGHDVALDGDTLVVGSDADLVGPNFFAGSAYIFERNQGGPNTWGLLTRLTANDAMPGDRFGNSVGISGDTIVVGSWLDDEAGVDSGSAYIFERDLGGTNFWGRAAKIEASDRAAGDRFGNSVAIEGDTVIVGAFEDDSPSVNAGSAYRFERDEGGADNWGEIERFVPSALGPGDAFGRSVALSGSRVLVGAFYDDTVASNAGAAYLFEVGASADLSISMESSPDPVVAGGTLTYTVTVNNAGPDAASGVQVSHTLPGDVSGPTSTGCAEDGAWTGTCTLGSIASGAMAQYTVQVTVDGGASGALSHTASVVSDADDDSQGNNTTTESTIIGGGGSGSADFFLSIQDTPDPVAAGTMLTYKVFALNNGPDTADVTISSTLPPGVTFVSTDDCGEDPSGVPECTLGSVLPGTSESFTITVTVDPGVTGNLTYTAVVSSDTPDPVTSNNTRSEVTTVGLGTADLGIVINDSADPAAAGDSLTYEITVSNAGPDAAQDTVVDLDLPPGVSVTSTTGCNEDPAGTPTCSLGEVAAMSSKVFTVQVQIDPLAAGTLSLTGEVSSSASESDPANNTAVETTAVEAMGEADLEVIQNDSADPIDAGEELTYTVVVLNRGPAAAQNVNLATIVDDMVGNPTTVGCDGGTGGVPSCDLGTLGPMQSKLVRITVQVNPGASGTLNNRVTVSSSNEDPDETNNTALESTTVIAAPGMADLLLSVVDTPDPATPGDSLQYQVKVVNIGPHSVNDVSVDYTVPGALANLVDGAGTRLLSNLTTAGCAEDPEPTGTCTLGALDANSVAQFTITGDIDLTATGILSFTATVRSATEDPDEGNNTLTETTQLDAVALADLEIGLVEAQDPVAPGSSAVYTISVENLGPADATDVVVAASVIGNIGTAITSGCTEDPGGLAACTLGTIPSGTTVTFTLEVPVPVDTLDSSLSTTVTVTSAVADSVDANNSATEETVIDGEPPVVERLDSIGDTGGDGIAECEEARVEIDRLLVTFDQSMSDPAGHTDPSDVTNPAVYQLVASGPDERLTTVQCGALQDDDVRIDVDAVTYDDATRTATLQFAGALPDGPYRFMVCGDTLADASGTVLDGNADGSPGSDFTRYFRIDTANLFANGHFDCGDGDWEIVSNSENEWSFSPFDVHNAAHSGSTILEQSVSDAFALGQCVRLSGPGNYRATGDLWLNDLATGDVLTLTWECTSFDEVDCLGTELSTESSAQTRNAATSSWEALDPWFFKETSDTAVSAMCSLLLGLDMAGGDDLNVFLDDLVLTDRIFIDGYETGDLRNWTLSD